ncbi:KH domain-containing protein [Raphanus sativus]|nr:KH domain-containing protein [Raphanus sativus]
MSGLYNNNSSYFSPARAASPQIRSTPEIDSSQYLTELLVEHQKLTPFMQVLPICSRLLNQEMFRVSGMMPNQGGFGGDFDRLRHRSPSPMASSNLMSNVSNSGLAAWNRASLSGGAPGSPSSYTVKRILRLEIPIYSYPNIPLEMKIREGSDEGVPVIVSSPGSVVLKAYEDSSSKRGE